MRAMSETSSASPSSSSARGASRCTSTRGSIASIATASRASAAKWFYLLRLSEALEVPGLYVFAFADGFVGYVKASEIDARRHRIAGRTDRVDAPNDQELIIDVPIEQLQPVVEEIGVAA
jgi:hypothetical protein